MSDDLLIVGAGPIGLACAISAKRRGFDPLVIDAGPIAAAITRYPVGMTFFTTPERLEIGGHPLVCSGAKATREEALKYYRGVVRAEELRVRTFVRLADVRRDGDTLRCRLTSRTADAEHLAAKVVLATGYFEHPNLLGVPGEALAHVSHYAEEPHVTAGLDVVIVGAKNSAIEQALNCFRAGARVTVISRRTELKPSVKYWLRPDFENRVKAGEISVRWGAAVTAIDAGGVTISIGGRHERLPADKVYLLTGYRPDFDLFRRAGIALDQESCRPVLNPETLETNVPGIHMAGSVTAGLNISEVFIENGRYDGEKIFGDPASRTRAEAAYSRETRATGE
ncbi:MAG: YpdA family putative bacillithiol disulfide reductase [Gemmatimonadales bacterium]|nr:YpdA family putative bacillithiol disulfide reductase [Gemmatimonadales bacterium]